MRYFLDTNIIIYCLKGMFPAIKDRLKTTPSQSIVIPAVVRTEIEYGARKSADYEETIGKYNKFMAVFSTEPFDEDCVKAYGRIRAGLEKEGNCIGPNDLMIAATVMGKDGILITHNVREFSRIDGLRVADWTEQDV